MALTYKELVEQDYKRQVEFNNVKWYHEHGFTGNGITILNAEGAGDHREMTSGVIKDYAPDATLLEGNISSQVTGGKIVHVGVSFEVGSYINLEDAIKKYNIKLITRSYIGPYPIVLLDYYKTLQEKYGVIFLCSAGNDGAEGVKGIWSKNDTAIAVGAANIKENGAIERYYYSAVGEELDFMSFLARGRGTSGASPALSAMIALLLNRYGDFNQKECVEILKSISVKLPDVEDYKQGWGLPILPLSDELKIIVGGTPMVFKDIEETRWSKDAIDFCVEKGLLVGFEDGTFRPTEFVTREQMAIILQRILNL